MTGLNDLYQDLILDHSKSPQGIGHLESPTHYCEGYNPLCGDKIHLTLVLKNEILDEIMYEIQGCAICTASASLMVQSLKRKPVIDAHRLFSNMKAMLLEDQIPERSLGKLLAFEGVKNYPSRIKCATLPWHTLMGALERKINVCSE